MTSAPVIVALGSNLGDSPRILLRAMARLEELSLEPLRKSSLWRTAPVNCPPGSPMFVNAVVALKPQAGETPESFLFKLQQIEREFGRTTKRTLNEPRPLDLDLISFGGEIHLDHPHSSNSPESWYHNTRSFTILNDDARQVRAHPLACRRHLCQETVQAGVHALGPRIHP